MLIAVQSRYHYVPEESIQLIAESQQISRARIISVVEFYSFLHLSPRGQYELLISNSITDHMLGKIELMQYLSERLQLDLEG